MNVLYRNMKYAPWLVLLAFLAASSLVVANEGMVAPSVAKSVTPIKTDVQDLQESLLSLQAIAVRNSIAETTRKSTSRANTFWALGLQAMEDRQYAAAQVFIEAFLLDSQKSDSQSAGHYWLARAEEALGRYSAAQSHFEKSRKLSRWGYYGILSGQRLHGEQFSTAIHCEITNEFLGDSPNLSLALTTRRKLNHLFPKDYVQLLSKIAKRYSIDETWLIALARQESAFHPDAVSRAGAIGLMQVMPETGNKVLRRKEEQLLETSADLFNPELNAIVGALYFKKLLRRFQGDPVFALAAYNAGPTAAAKWQSRWVELDPDLLIERIPYDETKEYVKRVTQWRAKYQSLLDSKEALAQPRRSPNILASATQH